MNAIPLRRHLPLLLASLAGLAVPLRAQTCTLTKIGQPCGVSLNGTLSPSRTLGLTVHAPGFTSGMLILGTQQLSISLPAGCLLRTDPAIVLPYSVGASGTASFRATVPAGFRGMVRTQVVAFLRARPGYIIRTSGAVELVCR